MPTNDERREVAARLREEAERHCDGFDPLALMDALGIDMDAEPFCDGFHRYYDLATFETWNRLADLIEPEPITGETSDGWHTFNELYHHRALLFSVIVRNYPDICWKSKKHHTGDMYEGMFIVGIDTPDGQASYHYDIEPYWDMFDCEELEFAPEWDGHTPGQAIERIGKLTRNEPEPICIANLAFTAEQQEEVFQRVIKETQAKKPTLVLYENEAEVCPECGEPLLDYANYCPNCGAKVAE